MDNPLPVSRRKRRYKELKSPDVGMSINETSRIERMEPLVLTFPLLVCNDPGRRRIGRQIDRGSNRRSAGGSRREPDFVRRLESVLYFEEIARKHRRDGGSRRWLDERHAGMAQPATVLGRMPVKLIERGGLRAHNGAHQKQD